VNPTARRALTAGIAILVPFVLLMTAIRLLLTPVFVQVEYRMPGFPPDIYGFSLEDRLHWSRVSLEYLLNDAGIEYLGEQQLQDGSPLYNERELSHMLDVKTLVHQMLVAWRILLIVLLALGLWAWRGRWLAVLLRGLGTGGRLTIGLIVLILLAVAISFRALFTAFHRVFFEGDTWLFAWNDNLIRLFPLRFWQDAFILMGVFTLLAAGLLIFAERRYLKRGVNQ
jgi:integral membrane protein (TIGR01906 family)